MPVNPHVSTHFGLVRHAPTIWNEQKRIQGQQDSPLSTRGRSMVQTWGEKLCEYKWDRILCSDLERVQHTVELINRSLNLPVQTDTKLREQNWGSWTGMTLHDVKKRDKELLKYQVQKGWNFRPPDGESRHEVLARSMEALTCAHVSWPGESILVACHEGVIKCLLYHLLGRAFLPGEPRVIESYNLHLLTMKDSGLVLEKMNHLALPMLTEHVSE